MTKIKQMNLACTHFRLFAAVVPIQNTARNAFATFVENSGAKSCCIHVISEANSNSLKSLSRYIWRKIKFNVQLLWSPMPRVNAFLVVRERNCRVSVSITLTPGLVKVCLFNNIFYQRRAEWLQGICRICLIMN